MMSHNNKRDSVFQFWTITMIMVGVVVAMVYLKIEIISTLALSVRDSFSLYMMPMMMSLFKQNQFVQVVVFGSVSAYVAFLVNTFYRIFILPIFTGMQCSIVIHNLDPSFHAVMDFISDRLLHNVSGSQYSLQANTKIKENKTRKEWLQEYLRGDKNDPQELVYRPDNDQVIHTIIYKGYKIYLERTKSQPLMGHDKPFTPESLKLTVWGSNNAILKELMHDAILCASQQLREGTVNIYTLSSGWCSGWELALTKIARPKESVILDMEDMDMLLNDARNFLQNGKWYVDMGIPYRRGYLLYGPPGCGKTSFAQVLAGELHLDICILNLTHAGLTDDAIAEYLRDAPQNSIIVLEDVDAVFIERTSTSSSNNNNRNDQTTVSFSGLLNALDGIASQEGRILFMTTNHIEKLDSALIRPGRCDLKLKLNLASKNQMKKMFKRFFPNENKELSDEFSLHLPENEISMATLQGYFLKYIHSPLECINNASELLQSSRLNPAMVKPIYEHLHRLGLEHYAVIFEYHNITTEAALAAVKLEDLEKMAVELVYDPIARGLLAQLLESARDSGDGGGGEGFIGKCYALAEVCYIRESFLAAYSHITTTNITASTSTATTTTTTTTTTSTRSAADTTYTDQQYSSYSTISSAMHPMSEDTMVVDVSIPAELSENQLRELSKEFCAVLSHSGRGVISLYNLQRLLSTHPHRPLQCIRAAREFVKARFTPPPHTANSSSTTTDTTIETTNTSTTTENMKYMTLYTFLKRAGLHSDIHTVLATDIQNIDKLLEVGKEKLTDVISTLRKTFKFDNQKAFRLAEILTKTNSFSGNFINFALFPSSRILSVFVLFYTMGSDSFRIHTKYNIYDPTNGSSSNSSTGNLSNDESLVVADTEVSDAASIDSKSPITTTAVTTMGRKIPLICSKELEELAYKFSMLTSDSKGTAVVSMLEVLDHLYKYPINPTLAVDTALTELVHPAYPLEPMILPIIPAPLEWVDEWLMSVDGLSQYASKFKEQGFVQESDFLVGGLLTLEELEKSIGVSVLAHRKRLVQMHKQLLLLQTAEHPSSI